MEFLSARLALGWLHPCSRSQATEHVWLPLSKPSEPPGERHAFAHHPSRLTRGDKRPDSRKIADPCRRQTTNNGCDKSRDWYFSKIADDGDDASLRALMAGNLSMKENFVDRA
ncbi:hypothetical protein CPY51_07330 [Rhizobium tubonense]|uniref:Uncharacterized protein n=1 Tax=Rhizobium tubonense TaxID=484088 RepID=A0A2W4DFQ4_9HYPH|nr:hypothetical protein CPY51_07330 [Rhizobium tubonense]